MLQIVQATDRDHFQCALTLIDEMARWDAEQSCLLGLDGAAVVGFFYSSKAEEALVRESTPPRGCLLLATFADAPAGCGAFRQLDANACELLHVYVRTEYRGQRIARRIVERLIQTAAEAGYSAMRLETATFMTEAQKLYASMDFISRDPYREVPEPFLPFTLCMELELSRKASVSSSCC